MYDEDEKVVCTIECDARGKRKGDCAVVTQKRIYKTGMTRFGVVHKKVVSIDTVSGAEWRYERFVRFLVLGVVFAALCCVMSAYFLPGGKTVKFVLGIVTVALGVAVLAACIIVYFRLCIKTVVIYFTGGKMHIASPGLSDEDADDFVSQVLRTAENARKKNTNLQI